MAPRNQLEYISQQQQQQQKSNEYKATKCLSFEVFFLRVLSCQEYMPCNGTYTE